MNDKQLYSFLSVVDQGSFSAAARKQYISPQAMVQQIDLLEQEVGVPLLLRTRRGVRPTRAGKVFYDGALELIERKEEILRTVRSDSVDHQTMKIGIFDSSQMMDRVCKRFSQEYPNIVQEYMMIQPENWLNALYQIRKGELDIFEHVKVPDTLLDGLTFTPLIEDPCFCVLSPSHPLANRTILRPEDLSFQQVGIHDKSCVPNLRELLLSQASKSVLLDSNQGPLSAFDLCSKGGIFIIPSLFIERYRPLRTLPLDASLYWTFGILSKDKPSLSVRLFLETAQAVYGKTVSRIENGFQLRR